MVEFKKYHPITLIIYFIITFFIIMFTLNPIILIISLISGIMINILSNKEGFNKSIFFYLIIFIIITVINPLITKQGETKIMDYKNFFITLEALIYGIVIAIMLISMIVWFRYYNEIMSSDKLIYLSSSVLPSIGLIISVGLKMIPTFQGRLEQIGNINKSMGLKNKKIKDKLNIGLRNISSLITQTLENSIDTADAMKARGYGIGKRTSFNRFRFKKRDYILLIFIGLIVSNVIRMLIMNELIFAIYPVITKIEFNLILFLNYITIFIFYFIPIIIEVKESLRWHYLKLKI